MSDTTSSAPSGALNSAHSATTVLLVDDEGENLQTVAALLGHRQTSTTERYSKTKGLAASNRLGATLKRKLGGK